MCVWPQRHYEAVTYLSVVGLSVNIDLHGVVVIVTLSVVEFTDLKSFVLSDTQEANSTVMMVIVSDVVVGYPEKSWFWSFEAL